MISTFVSATDNFYIITLVKKTKNNAIDGNIGHPDIEIDRVDLEGLEGMKIGIITLQVDCFVLPDGPDMIVLNSTQFLTGAFSLVRVS